MALRRRHIFLDMQYECDTSKAARVTGADLSIHRLEKTVTQRPYTAVKTSPCSRNPFLTLQRPAKLPEPVYTSRVGGGAGPGALVYLPTPHRHGGCAVQR